MNIFYARFKAAAIDANAKANANVIANAKANASGCRQQENANIEYAFIISEHDSSAFNTIIPTTLTTKLEHLELSPSLCQWISNFLTGRHKTKELIVDFSTKQEWNYQTPLINESPVERVESFRYLGVHIMQDLSGSCHINTVVKKALRDFGLPSKVLRNFYSCTIESNRKHSNLVQEQNHAGQTSSSEGGAISWVHHPYQAP
ncbi:hypothetical protein QTP86_006535 [Hemibagrus guttatus]|nr:hypothetical protein QTP86_006535 [Hemibagrus guttatus]